ncbi:uncharacterized protein DSM5745_05424 [Aspergillus mulundensis]|uniref:Uncharacterized protein n=1 Tax=Aspergillus mulundensis TaxID=1810919 RepID=A0A3D8RWX4_9EURO|nr:hypothetical protein DSM5745_05424 [Aspergillus mulundensis]RDW78572.1 hypothetical protein DSM5745_05424 [Aspergillus mulundensis]
MSHEHKALAAEHRIALAEALEAPTLHALETLYIEMSYETPQNHSYQTALAHDPDYPHGDSLNLAVFKLAQRSLRELYLGESWPISSAIWGACDGISESLFPYLKIVHVDFPLITYDGGWLYTGNPDDARVWGALSPQSPLLDPGSDLDSNSPFNPEHAEKIYPGYHNMEGNGDHPWHEWRVHPDPEIFHPILAAMANAVLRMPNLEHLRLRLVPNIDWCCSGGSNEPMESTRHFDICLNYLHGEHLTPILPLCYRVGRPEKPKWIVESGLEGIWEIPEDIRDIMKQAVGEDGKVFMLDPEADVRATLGPDVIAIIERGRSLL